MKRLLRSYLINVFVIYIASFFIPGLTYSNDVKILLLAALAFGLVNMFIKPFVKVIFLPVNILTLGLFSWVINVILLFLSTAIVPGFEVTPFKFPGYSDFGFTIPVMHISTLGSFVISSFVISFFNRVLYWLIK